MSDLLGTEGASTGRSPQRSRQVSLCAIILLTVITVASLYAIMAYNSLVTVKHNVSKAWANIDVLLKQRHDEIPKPVEICKQYRQFEQGTSQRVIEARSKVFNASPSQDMGDLGKAETQLRGSLANCSPWQKRTLI